MYYTLSINTYFITMSIRQKPVDDKTLFRLHTKRIENLQLDNYYTDEHIRADPLKPR